MLGLLSLFERRFANASLGDGNRHPQLVSPLTSRISSLFPGEFILTDWQTVRLNVPTAVKRGIYTVEQSLIIKLIGELSTEDIQTLEASLRLWLAL